MKIENKIFKIKEYITNPHHGKNHIGKRVIGYILKNNDDSILVQNLNARIVFGILAGINNEESKPFKICEGKNGEIYECNYISLLDFPYDKGEEVMDWIIENKENLNSDATWEDLKNALINQPLSFLQRKIN